MTNSFRRILVPVDFTVNTEVAVKKTLDLAESGTEIHLLHVKNEILSNLSPASFRYLVRSFAPSQDSSAEKMQQWKWAISELRPDVTVITEVVLAGNIQKCIEKEAKAINADLILICKKSHHSWFPFLNTIVPVKIAKVTGIPVLTVKPGSIYCKIRNVVVPVSGKNSAPKIEMIEALCGKFPIRVHLVTFLNKSDQLLKADGISLVKAYQKLKNNIRCPIQYAILKGGNRARAILEYANRKNADTLLVHPETETRIGLLNRQISDVLPPASKVQVLTVA